MSRYNHVLSICIMAITALQPGAQSAAAPTDTDVETTPEQFVQDTTDRLLTVIAERRKSYHKDPEQAEQAVAAVLEEAVDFAGVAQGVLGSHAQGLSDEEIKRFEKIFRRTLISVITDALVSLRPASIDLRSVRTLSANAVRVPMHVKTEDGQTFELSYTMVRGDTAWQVRNVVIDGVNLGMTYRNQFNSLVQRHQGDASAAIDDWETIIGDVTDSVTSS